MAGLTNCPPVRSPGTTPSGDKHIKSSSEANRYRSVLQSYFLQYAVNLATQPIVEPMPANIPCQAHTTVYTDTAATGSGPRFYRVGVP